MPPIFPPEPVPEELVEETRRELERRERMQTPLAPGERVDPNRDADVELARLPGIGPALAGRIVESREREGPFANTSDLLRVSGIGPSTLDRVEALLDLDAPPPGPAGGGPDAYSAGRPFSIPSAPSIPSVGARIELNRAGPETLETLPGVGPAIAGRIVEHREREGAFRAVEELLEVPGIGPATLERLRPLVRVSP